MTIRELDSSIKEVVDAHSVCGAEAVINALVRACKNKRYMGAECLHGMLECAILREINRDEKGEV